jgi:hypothetical protein
MGSWIISNHQVPYSSTVLGTQGVRGRSAQIISCRCLFLSLPLNLEQPDLVHPSAVRPVVDGALFMGSFSQFHCFTVLEALRSAVSFRLNVYCQFFLFEFSFFYFPRFLHLSSSRKDINRKNNFTVIDNKVAAQYQNVAGVLYRISAASPPSVSPPEYF